MRAGTVKPSIIGIRLSPFRGEVGEGLHSPYPHRGEVKPYPPNPPIGQVLLPNREKDARRTG